MTVGHQSVLLTESISALAIRPNGVYIDATFGRGGHSRAILAALGAEGRLIAIDKDQDAVDFAQQEMRGESRFTMNQGSFAEIGKIAETLGVHGQINGILFDLGVSSPQLDTPERGFSFMHPGPLDMRMDQTQSMSAAVFVNEGSAQEMAQVFKEYGEERFAKRIANAIVAARTEHPIVKTERLAEIVKRANPKWEKHKHPATRVFQAIRIHVNQELAELKKALSASLDALAVHGRLVVVSFHSLEDRIVKQFMRTQAQGVVFPPDLPIQAVEMKRHFKRIGKAMKPSDEEIQQNVRARSAVLRIGEKIA